MANIGFIGLGHMGGPMAENLVGAGRSVAGFDLWADLLEAAGKRGIRICGSASEAAAGADCIITMLACRQASVECLLGWRRVERDATRRLDDRFLDC